jgi:hypothetical protein
VIRGSSIPLAEIASFQRVARRTAAVRIVLAIALVLSAAAALTAADRLDVGETTLFVPGASGVLVLDLSSSIDAAPPAEISGVMRRLVDAGGRAGLVLFSDVAYEALPASSSTEELRPYLRFFRRPRQAGNGRNFVPLPAFRRRRVVTPWSRSFRGGTSISAGLEAARRMIRSSGGPKEVMLISDLNDSLFDIAALSATLLEYRQDSIRLRIVPVNATGDSRAFFTKRVGRAAFVRRAEFQGGPTRTATRTTTGRSPRVLMALAVLIALLLGANELWCGRLVWRRA